MNRYGSTMRYGSSVLGALALLCVMPAQTPADVMHFQVIGVLVDPANMSFPDATIELFLANASGRSRAISNTKPDEDGRFHLEAAWQPGTYQLKIVPKGLQSMVLHVAVQRASKVIDLGRIMVKFSCTDPGVICDDYLIHPLPKAK
jgi:hypothetical protein